MNANRNLTGSKVILISIDHGNSHIKTDRDVITSGGEENGLKKDNNR